MLGVDKAADKAEIRTAYKKLVLKCHPDKVQDATLKAQKQEEFQKVQQAYELLNDDAARAKYEDQVKLHELRKQAAAAFKANMPNSSAARSPPSSGRHYAAFDVRTAEPRYKTGSGPSPTSARMNSYSSSHSRSHEDMPSRPPFFDVDDRQRSSRRTTSYDDMAYEKPLRRDDDRRDDRRRRRDDDRDYRARDRSRDRSKERDRERKEKKSSREKEAKERDRDRDRKAKADEKARRPVSSAYVEEYDERERDVYMRQDKVRPTIRKEDSMPALPANLTREKSSSRRPPDKERNESPPRRDGGAVYHLKEALNYIEKSRGERAAPFKIAQPETAVPYNSLPLRTAQQPPTAPTPPPPSNAMDELKRASLRGAARRASHEPPPKSSKDNKTSPAPKKTFREDYAGARIVDAGSPKDRSMPSFKRGETAPPGVPDQPPLPRRSSTQLQEPAFPRHPPFTRAHTWADENDADAADRRHARRPYDDYDDVPPMPADDQNRRRAARRGRSPDSYHTSAAAAAPAPAKKAGASSRRYKVEDFKTTRIVDDPLYFGTSSGRYTADVKPGGGSYAGATPFRVKEGKNYGLHDVKYAPYAAAEGYMTYTVREEPAATYV